jgi:methyl-accepting chemotaxis protein
MFRKLSISKRFSLILVLIFIVTLPLITSVMYYFFRENAIREVADKALLTMHSMESLRKYVGKELRPIINKELPKKFVLEGASGFYILRKVSYNLQEFQPNYLYKQASSNPLAPENKADYYEEWFLSQFKENSKLKELTGLRTDKKEPLYYIARPVRVDRDECMKCHGDPLFAPKEQKEKYGTTVGYNYVMDSVVGSNIIYVPASVPIAIAKKSTAMVAIVFTGLFFVLFAVINILIRKSIIHPIESFVKTAEQVSKGQFDNKFEVKTEDELKTLADAFTRLKTSIIMLMDMMKKSGT